MKLFDYANQYLQESDWKIFSLVKFCLFSMGVMVGVLLPRKYRKTACAVSAATFFATYIPLMSKFFRIVSSNRTE